MEPTNEPPMSSGKEKNGSSLDSPTERTPMTNNEPNTATQIPFENLNRRGLIIHTIGCGLIYPFLFGMTEAAQDKSLFQVRLIVGLGCTIVGIAMAFTLNDFIKRFIESMTWTTLIQQKKEQNGMSLRELSSLSTDPLSPLSSYRLFKVRRRLWGARHPSQVKFYIYVVVVLVMIVLASGLSFALGRIIDITTRQTFDRGSFNEAAIFGDIGDGPSTDDMFNQLNTQIRSPDYADREIRDPLPPSWKYNVPITSTMTHGNETIYFTNPYKEQLRLDGSAFGSAIGASNFALLQEQSKDDSADDSGEAELLYFPQWGLRNKCGKIPDIQNNLLPTLDSADVRLPRDFVAGLYGDLGLEFPEALGSSQPDYGPSGSLDRFYFPTAIPGNSSTPGILTTLTFRWDTKYNLSSYGPFTEIGRHIAGYITDRGDSGDGWTIFDVFLMRCYAILPSATGFVEQCQRFPLVVPVLSDIPPIGYDAVACVHRIDPWIIEVRNSSRVVTVTGVVEKGGSLNDVNFGSSKRKTAVDPSIEQTLRSRNKKTEFYYMYVFSTYTELKRTGTMGQLTEVDKSLFDWNNTLGISIPQYQAYRGVSVATNHLPFLAGGKQLVSRQYQSKQVANAKIHNVAMAIAIVILFLAGLVGCFCVPSLPDGRPMRRFDAYSWMVALKGDGLDVNSGLWRSGMTINEAEHQFGNEEVNFHDVGPRN